MLSSELTKILKDVSSGNHASPSKINRVLDSDQSFHSSPERFEFSKALLTEILKDPTGSVALYFPPAIECLRVVTPSLKISDSSPLDIVARVEKYTIKFAELIHEKLDIPCIRSSATRELGSALRLLFHSRLTSTNTTLPGNSSKTKRATRRSKQFLDHKENRDPQTSASTSKGRRASGRFQPNEVSNILDRGLFVGASELVPSALLPNKDSSLVTRVITSALTLRLSSDQLDVPLGERIYLIRAFAIPWIRQHQAFAKPSNHDAILNIQQVTRFLTKSSSTCKCEITKLRILSLLCSVLNSAPHSYALELHRSVKKVVAQNGLMQQDVLDTVVSIYEDAMKYVSSFPSSEVEWTSEDFSLWLDHVLHVWVSINRNTLPTIFYSRITAIDSDLTINTDLVNCMRIQVDLFDIGAYSRKLLLPANFVSESEANEPIWKKIHETILLIRTPDLFVFRTQWCPKKGEFKCGDLLETLNSYLRFLHVIEPIRAMILDTRQSKSRDILNSSELLIRRFVSTLVVSLNLADTPEFAELPLSQANRKRLTIRLNLLVGGAFEACKSLVDFYWETREVKMACTAVTCIISILEYYSKYYQEYHPQWWGWFLQWMAPFMERKMKKIERQDEKSKLQDLKSFLKFIRHCDNIITQSSDEQTSYATKSSFDPTPCRMTLLGTARKICISLSDSSEALLTSHKMMTVELSNRNQSEGLILFSTPSSFMLDLLRVMKLNQPAENDPGHFEFPASTLQDSPITPQFMILLIMEYQCFIRSQQETHRKHEDYLETLYGLQRGRYCIYKQIPKSKQCLLHQFHNQWLSFVFEKGEKFWKSTAGKSLYRALSQKAKVKCDGHSDHSAFGFESKSSTCDSKHNERLALIADVWRFTEEEQFPKLDDVFENLENSSFGSPLESYNRTFLLVAAEVLDWASFVLASRDYDIHAFQARRHAEDCREAAGVPVSENPFLLDLCLRLGLSDYVDWYLDRRPENSKWPEEFRKARQNYLERNFAGVLAAVNNQEYSDLLSYEKALAHEYGSGNITQALTHSHKALVKTVRQMQSTRRRTLLGVEGQYFALGGAKLKLGFDVRVETGQDIVRQFLELAVILFHHARLQFEAENINDGQYYMERCHSLVSQLLPKGSYLRLSASAAYHAKQSKKPVVTLKDVAITLSEKSKYDEYDRNVISEHEMWSQLAECRHRHGEVIPKKDIIYACNASENAIKTRAKNPEWAERASLETDVLRAIALSKVGDHKKAIQTFQPLADKLPDLRANLRVAAHYYMVGSMWQLEHGQTSITQGATQRATRRKPRSKALPKHKLSAKLRNAIDEALGQVTTDFNVPWICRRIFGLQSLKIRNSGFENCATDVALLSKRIGASFNVRWRFMMNNKIEALLHKGESSQASRLQEMVDIFGEMSIGELEHLIEMLTKNRCVLIGIDLDETMESLILWRVCSQEIFLEKRPIPKTGRMSLSGVLQRMKSTFTITEDIAKPGRSMTQKEKYDWWANRHRLDKELESIISEMEAQWIGDASYIFEPEYAAEDEEEEEECGELPQPIQVVLLVNTHLEQIPWESIGVLRELSVGVTRCPSLAFLEYHLRVPPVEIDQRDLFYLVNPTGEFAKTENLFRDLVTDSERGWNGFCGKCAPDEIFSMYNDQSIYLYCGHGNGTKFVAPRRFGGNAPVTLLMGCSSAKPSNLNVEDEESNGAAIDFIINGAPAVVGTLWDVSDGEIDRFTLSLLAFWTGVASPGYEPDMLSLGEAVAKSRATDKVKLQYLVGASCIVIGAPNIRVKVCT